MPRVLVLTAVLLAGISPGRADDSGERARAAVAVEATAARVLAEGKVSGSGRSACRAPTCDGSCCDRLPERVAAAKAGKKPLVIWVAVAPTPAASKALAGVVHCRVKSYGEEKAKPRVILCLEDKAGDLVRAAEFDTAVTPERLREALAAEQAKLR